MKYGGFLLILFVTILFFGCASNNEVSAVLANADSVEVRFANTANDQLSHNTANPAAVKKLAQLVSKDTQTGTLECASNPAGIILFFEKGQMKQAVMFSDLKAKCRYFITKINDKTYHSEIDDGALHFLQSLHTPGP